MIYRRALLAAAPALTAFSSRERLLLTAQRSAPPPSLDLPFLIPGTLPPGLTFTRASTATYFDATGTMQSAAINAPRWDYDPSTLALRGLLIEEARTNSIRNSVGTGVVVGAPGTPPANWAYNAGTTGLSVQTVGTGTEAGIAYIDVRFFGTTTAAAGNLFVFDTATAITAATGDTWTHSMFWRLSAGTLAGVTGCQVSIRENTSAGALVRDNTLALPNPSSAGLGMQRVSATSALSGGATTARVQARVVMNFANATAVDLTVRIAAPQTELGASPTSYIPTTVAAVTRSADVCTAPTGAWFNAAASSLAADFMVAQAPNPSAVNARSPAALNDGSANNRLVLYGERTSSSTAVILTGITGTNTGGPVLGSISANAVSKIAGAWNGTAAVGALNGATAVSYAIGMPAGLTTMVIGTDGIGAGTSYLNGWARRVRYWNRALAAAELQSVTT